MKSNIYSILSAIFLAIGFIFLFNSASTITGYAIAQDVTPISSTIFSAYFFAGAVGLSYLANKQKRGQSAMEFLMTYGWAIIILILVLGLLAYFGVFTNKQKACDTLLLSPPFTAQGSEYKDGLYSIEILNTLPVEATITKVEIDSCSAQINKLVKSGNQIVISATCPSLAEKAVIKLYYIWEGSNLVQVSKGDICPIDLSPGQGGGQNPEEECGNSLIESQEQCDDSNTNTGDGCDDFCQRESGYECIGEPSVCTYTACCEFSEILVYQDCLNAGGQWYCAVPPICGNEIVEQGEECDDGNLINGDGCSNQCIINFECSDGADNDADGKTDYPEDLECTEINGLSES
ncbi:DUF4215 domain-containing protein [Candidatus Pacearchaeota archaeon]|nr:DUF4215 domain-containing protein [Candidatus Pacearchaeota archaeon]